MSYTHNKDRSLRYEALALGIALIWGATFIMQKTAMEHTGPWLFVGLRFTLAIPLLLAMAWLIERDYLRKNWRQALKFAWLPGAILALSSIMQQVALQSSYAGKAGLITSLYVCIIPFAAIFFGYKLKLREICAAICAFTGLYFLSVKQGFTIERGDALLILSAFGWTAHILALDWGLRHSKPFTMALMQTIVCSLLVDATVPFLELDSIVALSQDVGGFFRELWWEITYTAFISVALAFGLQLLAQLHLSPNRAGLLFSMEGLFAPIFGWILLGEILDQREIFGGALMLASLFIVRLRVKSPWRYRQK